MNNIQIIISLKLGYLLLALGLLSIIVWLVPKPEVTEFQEKRVRMLVVFRTVNALLIVGFVLFEVKWPLWIWLAETCELVWAYLGGDLVNFGLLTGYLLGMLYLAYRMDRKTKGIGSGFRSYLMQYGYYWLFVINIFVFLRLDYYYLPLLPGDLPFGRRLAAEAGSLTLLIGLQLLVLFVRKLKMVPAGPELEGLVREVAGKVGVKIKRVRIWRLEKVANAFAAGIFMKSIYLTEALVDSLDPDDLRMIVGHECAHFKKHHLELRVAFIAALVLLGSSIAEDYPEMPMLIYGLYWGGAVLAFKMFARFQEFQADRVAAQKLGGGARMAEALTRLSPPVRFGRIVRWLVGHPDLEARVKRLSRL